jgi:hypothetical protein
MKIDTGKRVRYNEQNVALDDIEGTVVEPTREEFGEALLGEELGKTHPHYGDVMVEWDDGQRFWERPADLVAVQQAEPDEDLR